MTQKSFEELGRAADAARINLARARQHLTHTGTTLGEEGLAGLIDVRIQGATWDNGMLALQVYVRQVIAEAAVDYLPEALRRMEQASTEALAAIGVQAGGASTDDPDGATRQVSRQQPPVPPTPPSPDLPEQSPVSEVFAKLSRQAQELLVWIRNNPNKRLSRTMERDELQNAHLIESVGTSPNNTWALSAHGALVVPA